ncbi:serine protease grass-like [Drosophila ficusphila]|uniref:serine protease grass-like n=1 Tax=Drosophila ficusphila TaxID=30025 RepID=UPI0007E6C5EB|nr:serine protease grass-like [Drosophila ficusphila]
MIGFFPILCLACVICLNSISQLEAVPQNGKVAVRRVYNQLRQQRCGDLSSLIPAKRLHRRITGGRQSFLLSQPWMAYLYLPDDNETCRCGGSLISERFVLTAAHCNRMCGRKDDLRVRLGEQDLNTELDCTNFDYKRVCAPPVEEFTIEEWIIHENFDRSSGWNDIALIRLNRRAVLKNHIRPICLPLSDDLLARTSVIGESYWAVGWGKDKDSALAVTTMEVAINTEECLHGRDETFLCADGSHVDTCFGDSGGPLTWSVRYFGSVRAVLFGVVSVGSQECGEGGCSYYMNVPTFMPWILEKLSGYSDL